MTETLTYRINDEGRMGEYEEGIVWSPGPNANTVWVLPYAGASSSEAVSVHAPTPKRPDWYAESAPWGMEGTFYPRPVTLDQVQRRISADGWCASTQRIEWKYAPALPRKTWHAALGIDNPAQLALTDELVAA